MAISRPLGKPVPIEQLFPMDLDINTEVNFAMGRARHAGGSIGAQAVTQSAWEQNDGSLMLMIEAAGIDRQTFIYPAGTWRLLTLQEMQELEADAAQNRLTDDDPYDWTPPKDS